MQLGPDFIVIENPAGIVIYFLVVSAGVISIVGYEVGFSETYVEVGISFPFIISSYFNSNYLSLFPSTTFSPSSSILFKNIILLYRFINPSLSAFLFLNDSP